MVSNTDKPVKVVTWWPNLFNSSYSGKGDPKIEMEYNVLFYRVFERPPMSPWYNLNFFFLPHSFPPTPIKPSLPTPNPPDQSITSVEVIWPTLHSLFLLVHFFIFIELLSTSKPLFQEFDPCHLLSSQQKLNFNTR